MEITIFKDYSEIFKNLMTGMAILIGGGWTLWKFVIQRERHPRIEFKLDLRILGQSTDRILIEVIAIIENKGLVRHYINDLSFDLLYLPSGQKLLDGDERINYQTLFNKDRHKVYWIPPDWYSSFIDPNIIQNYTYLTSVPKDTEFVSIYANFRYPKSKDDFHTAQKTFNIKTTVPNSY